MEVCFCSKIKYISLKNFSKFTHILVGPAENSQTYVSPDSYDSGQRNFSTVPSINQHTSEQTLNNNPFKNAMSMKKVKTEIVDDNFNQFGSSTSNQIDDDILFLSNELSKVVSFLIKITAFFKPVI